MHYDKVFQMKEARRRIVEITLYWNEDVIFEERIRNTLEYADFLYVSEGNESHSGLIKREEYQFPKLLKELAQKAPDLDLSRVVFVSVDLSGVGTSPYERERAVRDAAFHQALKEGCISANDLVIIQDFDEFLHPGAKARLLNYFSPSFFWRKAIRPRYRMTYYKLNLLEQNSDWDLVLVLRGAVALKNGFSPNFFRHDIRKKAFPSSKLYLGWHHSYLGNSAKIMEKIKSFSHALDSTIKDVSEEEFLGRLTRGEDLFGRNFKYQTVDYAKLDGIPALLKRSDLFC